MVEKMVACYPLYVNQRFLEEKSLCGVCSSNTPKLERIALGPIFIFVPS